MVVFKRVRVSFFSFKLRALSHFFIAYSKIMKGIVANGLSQLGGCR